MPPRARFVLCRHLSDQVSDHPRPLALAAHTYAASRVLHRRLQSQNARYRLSSVSEKRVQANPLQPAIAVTAAPVATETASSAQPGSGIEMSGLAQRLPTEAQAVSI